VALQQSIPVTLKYGDSGEFSIEMDADRVAVLRPGPQPHQDAASLIAAALSSPIDLPTLDQTLVPEDRVVIALDRDTPCAADIISGMWTWLERREIRPDRVTILQPASISGRPPSDPRKKLPDAARDTVAWRVHDPTAENSCSYVATTSSGAAIYLARELVDADVVIPVGVTAFDPLLGYRGTTSVLYPGLSTVDAMRSAIGQGHTELGPSDQRPLRQLVDEIAWLMGIQFCVQVIAAGSSGITGSLAGSLEAVFERCREQLDDQWMISMPERVETVIVAVSNDTCGHGWSQLGQAVATARQLVNPDGRIVILSELSEAPGDGVSLLRHCEEPADSIQRLRSDTPADLIPATQLAGAASWARLFLLSNLDSALVEDLFMYPLEDATEVARIVESSESCAFIGSAQHTFGIVD
jgi:nickel-dependent lactate racemase